MWEPRWDPGPPVPRAPSQQQPGNRIAIHSLFQSLPQVLEPALRRHQLLQLVDQSLRLQETQSAPGEGSGRTPHPILLGHVTLSSFLSLLQVHVLDAPRAEELSELGTPAQNKDGHFPSPASPLARASFNVQIYHFAEKNTAFSLQQSPLSGSSLAMPPCRYELFLYQVPQPLELILLLRNGSEQLRRPV